MRSNAFLLRNLSRKKMLLSPAVNEALINSSCNTTKAPVSNSNSLPSLKTFFASTATITASTTTEFDLPPRFSLRRSLCSSPSASASSNTVEIDSEEKFRSTLRRVQDEALPAIFYFTAVWCGPCRLLSPLLGQLIENYPNVTTYKIDIDQFWSKYRTLGARFHSSRNPIVGCPGSQILSGTLNIGFYH